MRSGMFIFMFALLTVCTAGCKLEPALYLRETVQADLSLATRVNLDLLWEVNWEADWTFRWNVDVLGPLNYTEPASLSLHTYALDANGNHKDHAVRNFYGRSAVMPVFVGTYDLLFHNNDSEILLFSSDAQTDDVLCTTRIISSGLKESAQVLTSKQKLAGMSTKGDLEDDATDGEPVALMPDGLFTLYDKGQVISDDLSQYDYIDGRYVLHIDGELHPATYIYLIQIHLSNNDGRVIGSEGGAAMTGLAAGVNLNSGISFESTVSVPMDVYMDRSEDMLGARMLTFGLPSCNPYEMKVDEDVPDSQHYLVLNITYSNGTWKNVRIDVTDAVRTQPLGGVITLELDVEDFPPEGGKTGDGGFNALIDSWKDEEAGITIIN